MSIDHKLLERQINNLAHIESYTFCHLDPTDRIRSDLRGVISLCHFIDEFQSWEAMSRDNGDPKLHYPDEN